MASETPPSPAPRRRSSALPGPAEPATASASRSVGFTLSTLGFAVSARFRERLAPLELEPRDFALLRAVGAAEGRSQQAIGEALRIPPSRMVGFVDILEGRELLERRHHPTDRRARALYLTGAGKRLIEEASAVAVGFEEELCVGLGEGERERLLELLGRILETLGVPHGVHAAHMQPSPWQA